MKKRKIKNIEDFKLMFETTLNGWWLNDLTFDFGSSYGYYGHIVDICFKEKQLVYVDYEGDRITETFKEFIDGFK